MSVDRIKIRYEWSNDDKRLVFVLSDKERRELEETLRKEYCAVEEWSREDLQLKKLAENNLDTSSW